MLQDDIIIFKPPHSDGSSSQEDLVNRECRSLRRNSWDSSQDSSLASCHGDAKETKKKRNKRKSSVSLSSESVVSRQGRVQSRTRRKKVSPGRTPPISDKRMSMTRSSKRFKPPSQRSAVRSKAGRYAKNSTTILTRSSSNLTPNKAEKPARRLPISLAAKPSVPVTSMTSLKHSPTRKTSVIDEPLKHSFSNKSSPRKRPRSCILQLVDQRKSSAVRVSEIRLLTPLVSTNQTVSLMSRDHDFCTPAATSEQRLLRSSASPSPASICSNSDILFRSVTVPPSDRVLRKRS